MASRLLLLSSATCNLVVNAANFGGDAGTYAELQQDTDTTDRSELEQNVRFILLGAGMVLSFVFIGGMVVAPFWWYCHMKPKLQSRRNEWSLEGLSNDHKTVIGEDDDYDAENGSVGNADDVGQMEELEAFPWMQRQLFHARYLRRQRQQQEETQQAQRQALEQAEILSPPQGVSTINVVVTAPHPPPRQSQPLQQTPEVSEMRQEPTVEGGDVDISLPATRETATSDVQERAITDEEVGDIFIAEDTSLQATTDPDATTTTMPQQEAAATIIEVVGIRK